MPRWNALCMHNFNFYVMYKLNDVYWNDKIKNLDKMHYVCIISMLGDSYWVVFLENTCFKLLKIWRDIAILPQSLKNTCEGV